MFSLSSCRWSKYYNHKASLIWVFFLRNRSRLLVRHRKKSFTNNLLDNVVPPNALTAPVPRGETKNNILFIYNKVHFGTGGDVMKFRRIKLKLYRRSANPERVCLGRAHPKIFILSRFAEVTSIVGFHFTLV